MKWFDIRKTADGWQYIHEPPGVVVLGVDGSKVLGRYEFVPPHGPQIRLVALSGTIEEGERPEQTAIRELFEESGYTAFQDDLQALGVLRPTKGSDYLVHGYSVDLHGRDVTESPGDGTDHEAMSYCRWIEVAEAVNSDDPVLIALLVRTGLFTEAPALGILGT